MNLPLVEKLGDYAFAKCTALASVKLPNVVTIDIAAFNGCTSLTDIDLPNVVTIDRAAFTGCTSLTDIGFGSKLKYINSDYYDITFANCPLTTVTLPATVQYVSYYAFSKCSQLKDVYCSAPTPPMVAERGTVIDKIVNNNKDAKLHVLAPSIKGYANAPYWKDFSGIDATIDDLDQLVVYDTLYIDMSAGMKADIPVKLTSLRDQTDYDGRTYLGGNRMRVDPKAAHLGINIDKSWRVGSFLMEQNTNFSHTTDWYGNVSEVKAPQFTTTFIPESPMSALGGVVVQLDGNNGHWKFVCLPFDVRVGDIKALPLRSTRSSSSEWNTEVAGTTSIVVRSFSGKNRAALNGNSWRNMGPDDIMEAGKGYAIFTLSPNPDYERVTIAFPASEDSKNGIFNTTGAVTSVEKYPAVLQQDEGWNLVGNPYPAYYRMNSSNLQQPYTVASHNYPDGTFEAFSPYDDDYVLVPHEAFFVQTFTDGEVTLAPSGRMHSLTVPGAAPASAPRRAAMGSDRQLYNIFLSGRGGSDRTRIVINPEAKATYEIACDAAKMSPLGQTSVPQLCVVDGGVRYAIDERPLGNGTFTLGTTTSLTDGDYTFEAKAGATDGRFILAIGGTTGISSVKGDRSDEAAGRVYTISGQRVSQPTRKGLYIMNGKKVIK